MSVTDQDQQLPSGRLYTRQFFQVFGAVILFMTAWSLQFHFGQYIEYLGGDVETLGWVMGISIVGTLSIRLRIGRWIDRLGCRPMWMAGTAAVAVSTASIQLTASLWLIVVLRTVTTMAFAAVMTTVAVFAAQIAPPKRRAESLGTLGMAGFMGMLAGATLGDVIFTGPTDTLFVYRIFFSASAICSLAAGVVMMLLDLPAMPGSTAESISVASDPLSAPSQLGIIRQHWPGVILLVGFIFTMMFCFHSSFLERLAEDRGFKNIKVFFLVYGPTAIVFRMVFRRTPERLGRTRTVSMGLVLVAGGLLWLVGIDAQWQLVLPGLLMGAGHCFIFPSMVDLAAERLPPEHRGTGTSLILGAGDLGLLTGFILLGSVIDRSGYDVALIGLAGAFAGTAAVFAYCRREHVWPRSA